MGSLTPAAATDLSRALSTLPHGLNKLARDFLVVSIGRFPTKMVRSSTLSWLPPLASFGCPLLVQLQPQPQPQQFWELFSAFSGALLPQEFPCVSSSVVEVPCAEASRAASTIDQRGWSGYSVPSRLLLTARGRTSKDGSHERHCMLSLTLLTRVVLWLSLQDLFPRRTTVTRVVFF